MNFSGLIAPGILQLQRGIHSMISLGEAMESGAIGLLCSLSGTYLYSRRKGAEALDAERAADIRDKETKILEHQESIQRLNLALAKRPRTGPEQHYYEMAKLALARRGPEAVTILYHMRTHGPIEFTDWIVPHLPSGIVDRKAAERVLEMLKKDDIVNVSHTPDRTGTKSTWKIAGGDAMLAALDDLLFPSAQ
jgi:hypothetical protein